MDDSTLEKITRDSAGKVLRREECAVWADCATLAWCRVALEGTDEGEEELESAERAEQAARAMIARLEREGFVPEVRTLRRWASEARSSTLRRSTAWCAESRRRGPA
jgi:hypothetical protein